MNTAFREVLFGDYTVFRSYLIALVVVIVGANGLAHLGLLELRNIPFTWFANMVGAFIFGIGMVLGGGCASGTLYRIGEGMIGSWMAAMGFMVAATAVVSGALRGVAEWFWYGPNNMFVYDPGGPVTLYSILPQDIFGDFSRWLVIILIAVPALIFVAKGNFKRNPNQKAFSWWATGIMIGLIGIIAFYTSQHYGHFAKARGLSFTAPLNEFVTWVTGKDTAEKSASIVVIEDVEYAVEDAAAMAGDDAEEAALDAGATDEEAAAAYAKAETAYFRAYADVKSRAGKASTLTWSVWMIFGLVLGSLTSAMKSKEFSWRSPKAPQLVTQFGGGLLMGFGGTIAGGCNIGHGFSGMATLALGSLLSLIFIILGSWTMVYFLFIRE
jgi:uncharacterized membrane protein YedE/YeeE